MNLDNKKNNMILFLYMNNLFLNNSFKIFAMFSLHITINSTFGRNKPIKNVKNNSPNKNNWKKSDKIFLNIDTKDENTREQINGLLPHINIKKMEDKINYSAILLAIYETIQEQEIFNKIKDEYNSKKEKNNDHYNVLLLMDICKNYLFNNKYKTLDAIENALDTYNLSSKLKFNYLVIQFNTNHMEDMEKIDQFLKEQKSADFNMEKHALELEKFMEKFNVNKTSISYDEIQFLQNISHKNIPNEYSEGKQLIKGYKYFIFSKEKQFNGSYIYYIIYDIKNGEELTPDEFKHKEKNNLFYEWLMNVLKRNNILIDNKHILNYFDNFVASEVFTVDK
jgi:hypothetical protein